MTTAAPGAWDGRAGAPEGGSADGLLDEVFALLPDAVSVSVAVRDAVGRAVDLRLEYANTAGAAFVGCPRGGLWSRTADDGVLTACLDVLNAGLPGDGTFTPAGEGAHRATGRAYRASPLGKDRLLLVLRDNRDDLDNLDNLDNGDESRDDGRDRLRVPADADAAQGEVARRLQESLLPRALPDVPGLELSARHHPGEKGTLVGGDFYDVFPGGPRDWTVTVGDVAGMGPRAAALTGLVRHTARAVGRGATAPAALLRAVNAAVLDEPPSARRFCTMACATLSPDGARTRLALALGGHPYPLLRRRDGTVVPVGRRGTLLGVVAEPRLRTVHHTLYPGDLLLFYTDGITEHRSDGAMFGEAGVRAVLARTPGASAGTTVRLLVEAVAAHGPGLPADDFAVLAVRVR